MGSSRLRFVVLVIAVALVAGVASQGAYAITWCFDWVAYQINDKKDTNPNRLTANTLRALLRKLGYTPVLQIRAKADPGFVGIQPGDIKLDVSQLAPSNQKIDKILKKGDVLIFSDDHAGIVSATRRPADARFDHFLQVPGKTGMPYGPADVTKLPNYFVGPGKNWSLKQIFALSRDKPPAQEDDWTLDYYSERLGRLVFGAPRQYPFLHSTVEVWRRSPSTAGTFVLSETKVVNPVDPELKIDAAGGTAVWDHTGQFGGAGKGGEWRVDYAFTVPKTITAGKSFQLTLRLTVSNVNPVQPLAFAFGARSPDFVGRVDVNFPDQASLSKTFSVPLSEGYKDFKEVVVIVAFNSGSEVTYVYRRAGA
jgi:hypothetical protein